MNNRGVSIQSLVDKYLPQTGRPKKLLALVKRTIPDAKIGAINSAKSIAVNKRVFGLRPKKLTTISQPIAVASHAGKRVTKARKPRPPRLRRVGADLRAASAP